MDFALSEEHKMFQAAIRDFAAKEVAPLVDESEKKEEFPLSLFPQMGKLRYLCVSYPSSYGAAEIGTIGQCIAIEELGKISAGIASGILVQGGIATEAILSHGTELQKEKYLIPAIKGEQVAAFGLTEPQAGSDVAAVETKAVRKGDTYILNGQKMFITNGPIANFVLACAYVTEPGNDQKKMSMFIVETKSPGFTCKKLAKYGLHSASTGEISFDDCVVPSENLVDEEGKGFRYLFETLDAGRIIHAARSLGMAETAYEAALNYAQQRVQFGRPIGRFQANSFKLARMAMEIESARWLIYRAAWLYDQGQRRFKEAAMCKLLASEACVRTCAEAMQIYGGYALMADSAVQRFFRDSRFCTITEGTSEIMEIVIARSIGLETDR